MKWISLILALFFTISVDAQKCCDLKLNKRITIKQLGQEYKRLRHYKNTDCCKKNGSGLMEILDMLSDSLEIGISKNKVIEVMGQPDKYASTNHPVEHHFDELAKDESVLIYYWRGMHDFLYFGFKGNKLVYKNWYYAFE